MLEFCLEDGAKLAVVGSRATATETKAFNTDQKSVETMFFDAAAKIPKTLEMNDAAAVNAPRPAATETVSLKQKTVETGSRALEVGTLVLALAGNWLQWLYIERQSYGTLTNFLFSPEFLIWLVLLFGGAAAGLLTLKFSRTKALAYAGLVVLAVNFLLLLVPKK